MSTANGTAGTPLWLWAVITILPFIVGVYSTRITHATAREARESSPYELLAKRVTELELADQAKTAEIIGLRGQVRDLQDAADADAHYIARLEAHVRMLRAVLTRIAPDQPIDPTPKR